MLNGIDFNPINGNPFTYHIMQSDYDINEVIYSLRQAFNAGMNGEIALKYALNINNVDYNDLTDFDKKRLERKVESLEQSAFNIEEEGDY